MEALRVPQFNRLAFSSAMGHWKRQGVLAVLCLDDFEVLIRHYRDFDDGFFDNLRSLWSYFRCLLAIEFLFLDIR
jgi:hypothetical protein